ncbi:hypothetical protein [Thiohalospira halophila]|uniref:hypothetical protein n=1 Tax=Thiohalospira halophila TaxID=381300 RepID=UPI00117DA381|nr:hypothetical protein [Thiohalospira halophila]
MIIDVIMGAIDGFSVLAACLFLMRDHLDLEDPVKMAHPQEKSIALLAGIYQLRDTVLQPYLQPLLGYILSVKDRLYPDLCG